MKFLYALRNRPPGYATVPSKWPWEYVEIPEYMVRHRPELPVTKTHRHGVISSEVQLTAEQLEAFEIDWLSDPDKDPNSVVARLYRIMRTTESADWPPECQEARRLFLLLNRMIGVHGELPRAWGKRQPPSENE